MKKHLTLFCCLVSFSIASWGASHSAKTLDRIVAVVNDQAITSSQLNQEVKLVRFQLQEKKLPLPEETLLRKQVLDHLIDKTLQLHLATQLNVTVDSASVKRAIAKIAQGHQQSTDHWQKALSQNGITPIAYQQKIHDELLVNRLQQQLVVPRVKISSHEVDTLLKQLNKQQDRIAEYHLQHILIPLSDEPTSEEVETAQKNASQILLALKDGKDFKQQAIEKSAGAEALQGGDWGWRKGVSLPDIFLSKIKSLKTGEITPPIRTGNGFHILKLVATRHTQNKHIVTEARAYHILLRTKNKKASTVHDKINQLHEKIHGLKSFKQIAESFSEDINSAAQGGKLGWVKPAEFPSEIAKAMIHLSPGKVSRPLHSNYGWHLIMVTGRRQVDAMSNLRQQQARNLIFQRKFGDTLQLWLQQLRNQAYIQYKNLPR